MSSRQRASRTGSRVIEVPKDDGTSGLVFALTTVAAVVIASPAWWAAVQGRREVISALTIIVGVLAVSLMASALFVRLIDTLERIALEDPVPSPEAVSADLTTPVTGQADRDEPFQSSMAPADAVAPNETPEQVAADLGAGS